MSIEAIDISKTFGAFKALDRVSVTVQTGELVALLGPSGSGKTTLLRIVGGLEYPDPGGEIRFNEENVIGRHVRERQVGFVFQHYVLFRHMSVFENIAFGLRVRPRRQRPTQAEITRKVEELLQLVQLHGLAGRYPHQLSGGQRQRVALARALAVEPQVLLLDEPFGALDAKVRQDLRSWLRRLHDEIHVTSIFVTHDQDEALEVADRVVVMNGGRIEQTGTPDEVFHRPRTRFVMDFLGQVNRFRGRIENGKAVFGGLVLDSPAPAAVAADGQPAQLFVRPYDVQIHLTPHAGAAVPGTVCRIQSAGSMVRLDVFSQLGELVHVQLPHDRFNRLSVREGTEVYLELHAPRIFVDDESKSPDQELAYGAV